MNDMQKIALTHTDFETTHWEAELWRAAAAHDPLVDALPHVLTILQKRMAIRGIFVRQLERPSRQLTTIASTTLDLGELFHQLSERRKLSKDECELLLKCSPSGQYLSPEFLLRTGGGESESSHELLLLPLQRDDEHAYFAFLPATPSASTPVTKMSEVPILKSVLEAALASDLRLRELNKLRQALEADKTALLSRLERQDITEVVIGERGGLKSVSEKLEQVAATEVPILILGETGSGKEVIARALHVRSRRHAGPVVRVNCGAIPSELIDSELFGHERGAFTGAIAQRKGWFERADGGTLFLDEIGELQPAAQVRLLRVLQEGTFERVGGQQAVSVDVRIVAATHRRLEDMVANGTFREDLWYRLNVFPISLPPLRERTQDIPALASHFARNAGRRLGLSSIDLTPSKEDLALLLRYDWPGNVRELAAVIERAAILGGGKKLEVAAALGTALAPAGRANVQLEEPQGAARSFPTLDQVTSAHIRRALTLSEGKVEGKGGAAELVGINPHTLRARMRKLGIDWVHFRDIQDH